MKIVSFIISLVLLFSQSGWAATLADAQRNYLLGNCQEAIKNAKGLRETDRSLYFLGVAYIRLANYSTARVYLRKLIKGLANSFLYNQARLKLADTYFLQSDYTNAKQLYESIKEDNPSDIIPFVLLRLAQIASRSGDWDSKWKYLNIIKAKHPDSSVIGFVKTLEGYGDFFTIQVGAFAEKINAKALVGILNQEYSAYIVDDVKNGQAIYKVRVGKYKTRHQAQEVLEKLLDKGYPAKIYP